MKWTTETRKISELKECQYNPRQLTKKQYKDLKKSLYKFGLAEIPCVNTDNTIIAGHQRIKILKEKSPDTEIEVRVPSKHLNKSEFDEYLVRSNKNTGEWDFDLLANSFDIPDLQDWGFEDTDFGFDVTNLEPEETKGDDDVPETKSKAITVKGDLYELGEHRLLCGDSTIITDVEKLMNGKKADMVFTDPPYGVNYTSRVDKNKRKQWGEIKNDNLKNESLWDFLHESVGYLTCNRYICCNWQSFIDFETALGKPNALIVWDKESIGLGAGHRNQHEFILFYGKLDHNSESNVWKCKRESTGSYKHPTQKPVEIPERGINNLNGLICYDAFLGSGSTLIACEKTNRKCYGMELDPKYCDVIVKRYIDFCMTNNRSFSVKRNGKEIGEFK